MACNPLPIDPQGQMQPPTPPQDSLCPYKTSKNEEPVLSDTGNRSLQRAHFAAQGADQFRDQLDQLTRDNGNVGVKLAVVGLGAFKHTV